VSDLKAALSKMQPLTASKPSSEVKSSNVELKTKFAEILKGRKIETSHSTQQEADSVDLLVSAAAPSQDVKKEINQTYKSLSS